MLKKAIPTWICAFDLCLVSLFVWLLWAMLRYVGTPPAVTRATIGIPIYVSVMNLVLIVMMFSFSYSDSKMTIECMTTGHNLIKIPMEWEDHGSYKCGKNAQCQNCSMKMHVNWPANQTEMRRRS